MGKYIFIIVAVFFLSCESRTKYKKPKDLIPKDQMIDLLTDLHLVNGISGVKSKDGKKTENYMSALYEKYHIDSTRFAASNLYYISNISEYEEMFEEVEKRLEGQRILIEDDSIMKPAPRGSKLKIPKHIKKNKETILK